jgi:DNA-binding GntR family transcriptional regulator
MGSDKITADRTLLKIPTYPNLTELAYIHVKQHILEGFFEEGAKLTEEALATQLGISKSPVREALNRLESDGLVCIEPRRGAYVRCFSLKEASDLYDLRELLEVHAISLAKITPRLLIDLEGSIARTKSNLEAGNMMAHVEEDIRFHNLIAAATANSELQRIVENLNQKSILCRTKTYHLSSSTAPESHSKIYRALKEDQRGLAQQAMREHILFVRDALLRSLQTVEADGVEAEWSLKTVPGQ